MSKPPFVYEDRIPAAVREVLEAKRAAIEAAVFHTDGIFWQECTDSHKRSYYRAVSHADWSIVRCEFYIEEIKDLDCEALKHGIMSGDFAKRGDS